MLRDRVTKRQSSVTLTGRILVGYISTAVVLSVSRLTTNGVNYEE